MTPEPFSSLAQYWVQNSKVLQHPRICACDHCRNSRTSQQRQLCWLGIAWERLALTHSWLTCQTQCFNWAILNVFLLKPPISLSMLPASNGTVPEISSSAHFIRPGSAQAGFECKLIFYSQLCCCFLSSTVTNQCLVPGYVREKKTERTT